MTKNNSLKFAIMDAVADFYQGYIKPEMRQMIEEVLEEKLEAKLEEKLTPIKVAIMNLERNVDFVLDDYKGQQLQLSNREKRIEKLEDKAFKTSELPVHEH